MRGQREERQEKVGVIMHLWMNGDCFNLGSDTEAPNVYSLCCNTIAVDRCNHH